MMYCPKCGKQLPDDAAFCDACGASFVPEQPELIFEQPKQQKEEPQKNEVKSAFRKWVRDQGLFCLIAKAVAVTVMFFYLLVAIVQAISLAVSDLHYSGGSIFSQFFTLMLTGIVYGVIVWLLSDAVLYLQKLYQVKKNEQKTR